ncbi:MAG: carbohydrate-binding protein [Bryobacteraceae bacterium]
MTSELPDAPVESVFGPNSETGWRRQSKVSSSFLNERKTIRRIQLGFREQHSERTQEFTLHWPRSIDGERTEIVPQQWTFSPQGSTREDEDYRVNLTGALVLELTINPNISDSSPHASLHALRIAS